MKKIVAVFLTSIMLIVTTAIPAFADENIKVLLNGQEISFDVPPQIINDRTMVPMRAIFEKLGYIVNWMPDGQYILAYSQNTDIMIGMQIDAAQMIIGKWSEFSSTDSPTDYAMNHLITLDTAPCAVDGRTLVPVRAISEASKLDVQWNPEERKVIISSSISNSTAEDALKVYASNLRSLYCEDDKTTYTDVRFKLADMGGNDSPELIAVGIKDNEIRYAEIFYYADGEIIKIHNRFYGYGKGWTVEPVILDGNYYLRSSSASSGTGFLIALDQYDGSQWQTIFESHTIYDRESGKITGYTVNESSVTQEEYEAFNKVGIGSSLMIDDFVSADDISNVYEPSYYNAEKEIKQIRSYIEHGLYLEAMQLCEDAKKQYTLSSEDISILDNLKLDAQNQYDEYVAEQKKWKDYYYDDWCLGFTGSASYKPTYYKGGDYVQVYQSKDSDIDITSYKIGTIGSSGKLTSNLKECVGLFTTMLHTPSDAFEIISETETTVGDINAYQRTYRATDYTNRYNTKANYQIMRHIVFKYGDWIYLITSAQNKYIWDDDFYNLLEKVRTSIRFY